MNLAGCSKNTWMIYLTAIIGSIILSLWVDMRQVVINNDGICYLQSAQTIGTQGIEAAIHLCDQSKWPFYPMLLYGLVTITKLSYTVAAFSLDAMFSAISVALFIAIVRLLGGTQRVLWFAAMVILLAHEFNSTRQYIVRDHGFWALYLTSVFLLLHFFRECKMRFALLWGISSFVALLFRVEGTLLLLMIPFVTFFDKRGSVWWRIGNFLKLNMITVIIGILIAYWFWMHPHKTVQQLGRLQEVQFQLLHGLHVVADGFHKRTLWLGEYVLLSDGARDATFIFIVVLIAGYLFNLIMNFSIIYTALFLYAWWKKVFRAVLYRRQVIYAYVIMNMIITAAFYIENLYLSKRYLLALTVTLMLWIPFALEDLFQRFRLYFSIRKIYWLFPIIIATIILTSLGGIFDFGYSKNYLRNSGDWLASHVPANAKLYANDYQLMYYSQHYGNQIFNHVKTDLDFHVIVNGQWKKYDYLAIRFDSRNIQDYMPLLNELARSPIKKFVNERGDQVSIYKVTHS